MDKDLIPMFNINMSKDIKVDFNCLEPYSEFDNRLIKDTIGEIIKLAESILKHGLLDPIIYLYRENNKYKIVSGNRRYMAIKWIRDNKDYDILSKIGLRFYELHEISDSIIHLVSVACNLERKNITVYDKMLFIQELKKRAKDKQELYSKIKETLGIGERQARKYLGSLEVRPQIKELFPSLKKQLIVQRYIEEMEKAKLRKIEFDEERQLLIALMDKKERDIQEMTEFGIKTHFAEGKEYVTEIKTDKASLEIKVHLKNPLKPRVRQIIESRILDFLRNEKKAKR